MEKEKFSKVSLRLLESEKEAIAQYAKDNGLNMSQVIRFAIKEYLENHKNWKEVN